MTMRGRKPNLRNVIPMRQDAVDAQKIRLKAQRKLIRSLRPPGLPPDVDAEYTRVAWILSEPTVDRLKPRFMDLVIEYCRCTCAIRAIDAAMETLDDQVYTTETRNGHQVKMHPLVGQRHERFRQWRSMVQMLGMSPADERALLPGQGDFFDSNDRYF